MIVWDSARNLEDWNYNGCAPACVHPLAEMCQVNKLFSLFVLCGPSQHTLLYIVYILALPSDEASCFRWRYKQEWCKLGARTLRCFVRDPDHHFRLLLPYIFPSFPQRHRLFSCVCVF